MKTHIGYLDVGKSPSSKKRDYSKKCSQKRVQRNDNSVVKRLRIKRESKGMILGTSPRAKGYIHLKWPIGNGKTSWYKTIHLRFKPVKIEV